MLVYQRVILLNDRNSCLNIWIRITHLWWTITSEKPFIAISSNARNFSPPHEYIPTPIGSPGNHGPWFNREKPKKVQVVMNGIRVILLPGCQIYLCIHIWGVPKMGLPPNHPCSFRIVHYNPSILRASMEPHGLVQRKTQGPGCIGQDLCVVQAHVDPYPRFRGWEVVSHYLVAHPTARKWVSSPQFFLWINPTKIPFITGVN